jgi:hypothetical protein
MSAACIFGSVGCTHLLRRVGLFMCTGGAERLWQAPVIRSGRHLKSAIRTVPPATPTMPPIARRGPFLTFRTGDGPV